MTDRIPTVQKPEFLSPIDGDCLNINDGAPIPDGLLITVSVACAGGACLSVNGVTATERDGVFEARVVITAGANRLVATNGSDGITAEITVFYMTRSMGKYRISSDDNILFLADLTENKDKYTSLFDNPYLAVYKLAHDLYGARVHLNLFYEFDATAAARFGSARPYFNLSMMTDKYKAEWRENSDWLRLSFHARREWPAKPYKNAHPDTLVRDFREVEREVLRFAGEETFSREVTTVHYGEASRECVRALRALGHRALAGYFELTKEGEPLVAYYAPIPLIKHIGGRDFWRDNEIGMTFARIDRVTNVDTLSEIMTDLEGIINDPHRGGFVSIMIHEQYFYSDYKNHLPDFAERVLEPARLLCERGYRGACLGEVIGETL